MTQPPHHSSSIFLLTTSHLQNTLRSPLESLEVLRVGRSLQDWRCESVSL
jgi:hypothetical protein